MDKIELVKELYNIECSDYLGRKLMEPLYHDQDKLCEVIMSMMTYVSKVEDKQWILNGLQSKINQQLNNLKVTGIQE